MFPIYVEVKPGADLVKVCQYPMPLEVTHQESTELGCPQTWAVSQEHTLAAHQEASYQMITDQSRTCKMSTQHRVQPLHPTQLDVPGPAMVYYPGTKRYIFFSFCLWPYFTFEWYDPEIWISGQLTWNRLWQWFKKPHNHLPWSSAWGPGCIPNTEPRYSFVAVRWWPTYWLQLQTERLVWLGLNGCCKS